MAKRYVFEVSDHDEAAVDALVRYSDSGGAVFINTFAGDAVSIYFTAESDPVGHAEENPVYCIRREEDGCNASFPGSKWDAIRANKEGWFGTREGDWYCPAHVPSWVRSWRARKANVR